MGLTKLKLLLVCVLFSSVTFGQNIRGYYVNGFSGILGNTTKENTLLSYTQGNGYNYLCLYDVSGLNLTSTTVKNQFASFINRAKTQYGVSQVGVCSEIYSFFSSYIIPYNVGRPTNEKVDVLNFEFEFWVTSSINSLYCSLYLTPGGYSCDTAGACAFAKSQFQLIDNAAAANGLISEIYFGWPNKGQMQWFAQRADRILLHAYRTSDIDVYSYSRNRLSDAASINSSVKIIPIFSSESSFMGPWLGAHPITLPYTTYSLGLTAELSTWKQYISLQGYHWFKYTTMPATTTVSASITAAGPITFCTGGSVVLTANSGSGQTYQWTKNGSNISGATSISYTASTSGAFAVKVTKSGTTATSASVTVTVSTSIAAPTISASGPVSFCPGGSVVLSSSSSTGNHWSNNATTQSITVSTAGSYTVTVTLGNCSGTSTPVVVSTSTTPVAPTITAGGSTSLCPGTGITLASSATASGGYVWSTGATTRSIVAQAAGTYWVRTGTSTCYSPSANKVTTMLTAPAVPTITANGSTNIGSGGSVTLTSSSASGYLWIDGTATQSMVATMAGNYRVTVTGSNGCKSTSANKLVTSSTCTPPAVPTISSSSSTNIIVNGGTVTLTASSTTGGWLWSTGATTRTISVSSAGTYTVRAYNAGSCFSTSLPLITYLIYQLRETGNIEEIKNVTDLAAFPNPSNGQFQVSFTCEKEQACTVNIYDLSGRIVMERNISAVTGNNLIEMNSTSLSSGMYLMRLTGEGINEQLRLSITE
ncbi:hypothetical protein BH11BAC1_BH11BAC1_08410 [soil metagenome]